MKSILIILLFFLLTTGCVVNDQEKQLPLEDGEYLFEHKFSEAEYYRLKSITLNVNIEGKNIVVINNDRYDVFPKGILEEGVLMLHTKSG